MLRQVVDDQFWQVCYAKRCHGTAQPSAPDLGTKSGHGFMQARQQFQGGGEVFHSSMASHTYFCFGLAPFVCVNAAAVWSVPVDKSEIPPKRAWYDVKKISVQPNIERTSRWTYQSSTIGLDQSRITFR